MFFETVKKHVSKTDSPMDFSPVLRTVTEVFLLLIQAADHLSWHTGSPQQSGQSSPCHLSSAVWPQPQVAPIRRMFLFLLIGMFEAVMERFSVCGIKCGNTFSSWGSAAQTLRDFSTGRDKLPIL